MVPVSGLARLLADRDGTVLGFLVFFEQGCWVPLPMTMKDLAINLGRGMWSIVAPASANVHGAASDSRVPSKAMA
jgi:hypothetical protein